MEIHRQKVKNTKFADAMIKQNDEENKITILLIIVIIINILGDKYKYSESEDEINEKNPKGSDAAAVIAPGPFHAAGDAAPGRTGRGGSCRI